MEVMGLNIGLPEAYILSSNAYSVLRASFNHGKILEPRRFSIVNAFVLFPTAMTYGGFFSTIGFPQIAYLAVYAFLIIIYAADAFLWITGKTIESKKPKERKPVDAPKAIMFVFLNLVILYWGGLFA
jgi:hypothetical protein